MNIPINEIRPAKNPVRTIRDDQALQDLMASIDAKGVLQPIKVRPVPFDGTTKYEIVFGARRWEASRELGLEDIPAVVEEMSDTEAIEQGLLENVEREDMPEKDIAHAIDMLCKKSYLSNFIDITKEQHEDLSNRIGLGKTRLKRFKHLCLPSRKKMIDAFYEEQPDVRDVTTKADYIATSISDPELQVEIVKKSIKEDLGQNKIKLVAQSIKEAKNPKDKQKLIEREFHSSLHNPELIRQQVKRSGMNPVIADSESTKQDEWDKTPEVKATVNHFKEFSKAIRELKKTGEIEGKLAPEAKMFLGERLKKLHQIIEALLIEWEIK